MRAPWHVLGAGPRVARRRGPATKPTAVRVGALDVLAAAGALAVVLSPSVRWIAVATTLVVLVVVMTGALVPESPAGLIRRAVRAWLWFLGAAGIVVLLGLLGVGVVVLLATGHPDAGRVLGRRSLTAGCPPSDLDPSRFSTDELVSLWRSTTRAVQVAESPASRALLAERRRACLDELEARDAEGVQRWLDSGPYDPTNLAPHLGNPESDR